MVSKPNRYTLNYTVMTEFTRFQAFRYCSSPLVQSLSRTERPVAPAKRRFLANFIENKINILLEGIVIPRSSCCQADIHASTIVLVRLSNRTSSKAIENIIGNPIWKVIVIAKNMFWIPAKGAIILSANIGDM